MPGWAAMSSPSWTIRDESGAEAAALAETIKTALCEPFDLGDHQVTVGASIGIAVAPRDGADSDVILKSADLALYAAKGGGRGAFRFFEPELDQLDACPA
ncbi:diguanylate cyclase domain-containing protein [Bradyrhizobium betae]